MVPILSGTQQASRPRFPASTLPVSLPARPHRPAFMPTTIGGAEEAPQGGASGFVTQLKI
ncbi:hypothetical protein AZA_52847 [Nitrospirillum viridazoti Y2]|nr:hypothetical protein AZA_52847 [Nitrospirillum amazonense Y2]